MKTFQSYHGPVYVAVNLFNARRLNNIDVNDKNRYPVTTHLDLFETGQQVKYKLSRVTVGDGTILGPHLLIGHDHERRTYLFLRNMGLNETLKLAAIA